MNHPVRCQWATAWSPLAGWVQPSRGVEAPPLVALGLVGVQPSRGVEAPPLVALELVRIKPSRGVEAPPLVALGAPLIQLGIADLGLFGRD